jgi:RNA polymerase I-specific transcription initiation factor RRN3
MNPPSSPTKRARVSFDPEVELLSADDDDDLDPLVVREQVRRAIQRHLAGDNDSYERLQTIFTKPPRSAGAPSSNAVRLHLQGVLLNISSLDKKCNGLITAIIFSDWVGRDESFCSLHIKFLANLAAAQSGYLSKIMQSLVDLLGPQRRRRSPEAAVVRQPQIHARSLKALQYIVSLVPSASSLLAQLVQRKLSFDFAKPEERMTFITNFMELMTFVPELKSEILSMVVRTLVGLDVSIQVALDEEDDEVTEEILEDLSSSQTLVYGTSQLTINQDKSTFGDDVGSTTSESDFEDDADLEPAVLQRRKLKDTVRQVDVIMDQLFTYYTKLTDSSSLSVRDSAVDQLISHFDNIILPTYRSRHPQFLIFHFAQTSPILVDRYVTSLISLIGEKFLPPVLRQSAAAYLAGFVGRGANVSSSVVRDCFALLCDDLTTLRLQHEANCRGPELARYASFYAIMQACMYIFCFRWKDLANNPDKDEEEEEDELSDDGEEQRTYIFPDSIRSALLGAIHSPLNPLRVCTPVIVNQFAEVAFKLQFAFLYDKLALNKNVRLISTRAMVSDPNLNVPDRDLSWVGESGMMEGHFPFDPYHLPVSKRWVEGDYVFWEGLPGEKREDEDSDEEDEDDVVDQDEMGDQEGTGTEDGQ